MLGHIDSMTKSATTNISVSNFLPKLALHEKLVTALFLSGPSFHLQVQNIRRKYDKDLCKHILVQYFFIPAAPIPIPHIMIVKIKCCRWSTNDIVHKLPSRISIACFVPMIKKDAVDIQNESEKVTKDAKLGQPEPYCSKIGRNIPKSYKVNINWGLLAVISLFLVFLYNLANWKLNDVRPMLCDFLENVLFHLTSEAGKTWLNTNKECKHLPLAILSQIQETIIHLVLAASDEGNHPNDNNPGETKLFTDGGKQQSRGGQAIDIIL